MGPNFSLCNGGGWAFSLKSLKDKDYSLTPCLECTQEEVMPHANWLIKEKYSTLKLVTMCYGSARYVVDGQDGDTICGPARTNDNFGIVNTYLNWNPVNKYMELITMGTSLLLFHTARHPYVLSRICSSGIQPWCSVRGIYRTNWYYKLGKEKNYVWLSQKDQSHKATFLNLGITPKVLGQEQCRSPKTH